MKKAETINPLRVEVHYLEVATGERAIDVDDHEWEDADNVISIYEDGNYSCDCNRQLFFDRALGREERDTEECSDGRFVIEKIVDRTTGQIIYSEIPDRAMISTVGEEK